MKYFKKIEGERLYLSPVNGEDVEIYTKWLNDKKVAINISQYTKNVSLASEKEFIENMAKNGHNYAIIAKKKDQLLGNISLFDIDAINKTAEIGLFIGDEENRGKGYGTEVIKLIVEYGFNTLNLNNILICAYSSNAAGEKCYKKVGFKEFGRRKKCVFINGKYCDMIYLEMLKEDWNE